MHDGSPPGATGSRRIKRADLTDGERLREGDSVDLGMEVTVVGSVSAEQPDTLDSGVERRLNSNTCFTEH